MPQNWIDNWPLADGSKGLNTAELLKARDGDLSTAATRKRALAVQTLGNLTILTSALNSAQSNWGWKQKRPELMKHSLRPINQKLAELPVWDETTILVRGEDLFNCALQIWPR